MTGHLSVPGGILVEHDRVGRAFAFAVVLHAAFVGAYIYSTIYSPAFGSKDAGGAAVAIQAVNSIPLPPHTAPPNPLASDTESDVPQAPAKPVEQAKKEAPPPPDAVKLKSKTAKKNADVATDRNRFRPKNPIDLNQVYSKSAPALSSPMFSAASTGGRVGAGEHTTLGAQCGAYSAQIQQLIASRWKTDAVDARVQTAPTVITTFDLNKDGTINDPKVLQGSGIPTLDSSTQRAIRDSSPFPPIPDICKRDHASVEIWFELKR